MRDTSAGFTFLSILAVGQVAYGQRITKYRVSTETSTATQTLLATTICAKLEVNPMPVCRRRRHLWTEIPISWSAPDQQFQIQPTELLQMESTEIPLPQFKNDQNSNFKENSHFHLISSPYAIQPSMSMPLNDFQKRIPYERITHRAKIKNKKRLFTNLLTLITLTHTKMTTEMVVTIQTRTVTISGCTPTPFPYNVCV
uniref:Uncharacterized protein n=1 Tax=Daphnia galeata TaxID=27404 RepID=A0A8J2RGX4_9CRUS|nr:unnamed protein product [Daphnia galeata]